MKRSNLSSTHLKVKIMPIINIGIDPANKALAVQGVDD